MQDKILLKKKFAEIAVLIFCEINNNTPGFCLVLSYLVFVKQITRTVLQK